MPIENIIFAVSCWLCSLIFGGISLWAFKRKDPMHFWSGSTVKPEKIKDIPAYNRANGLMWAVYTACFVIAGFLSLFSIRIGGILLSIICVPGIFILFIVYKMILKKYRNTSVTNKTYDEKQKTPKGVIVAITAITAIILIGVGVLLYYGEKDPVVIVHEDHIEIKDMYGLNINYSEISDLTLIEKSMKDIGIGTRTNGFDGFGDSLKGYFKSDNLGNTLLFVQAESSPTIRIERIDQKDVYISFKNSETTKQIYQELMEKISQK